MKVLNTMHDYDYENWQCLKDHSRVSRQRRQTLEIIVKATIIAICTHAIVLEMTFMCTIILTITLDKTMNE